MPPRYQSHFLKGLWRKAAKFGGNGLEAARFWNITITIFLVFHANQIWVLHFILWYRSNSRYADQRNLINTKTFDMTIFCRLEKTFNMTIFRRLEKNFWHEDLLMVRKTFDMTSTFRKIRPLSWILLNPFFCC